MPLLAVVAIVAVVAVVLLVLQSRTPSSEEAVAGEAIRLAKQTASLKTCPTALKDYEIRVGVVQGRKDTADFIINKDIFTLTVQPNPASNTYRLASGATVGLDSAVRQDYAGGVNVVDWDLSGACASDYAFTTEIPSMSESTLSSERYGTFTVVSTTTRMSPVSQEEVFTLYPGDAKVLRDGAKIIYRDVVRENYAGGLHGVLFELICS